MPNPFLRIVPLLRLTRMSLDDRTELLGYLANVPQDWVWQVERSFSDDVTAPQRMLEMIREKRAVLASGDEDVVKAYFEKEKAEMKHLL